MSLIFDLVFLNFDVVWSRVLRNEIESFWKGELRFFYFKRFIRRKGLRGVFQVFGWSFKKVFQFNWVVIVNIID